MPQAVGMRSSIVKPVRGEGYGRVGISTTYLRERTVTPPPDSHRGVRWGIAQDEADPQCRFAALTIPAGVSD